jgi:hypothetical protein
MSSNRVLKSRLISFLKESNTSALSRIVPVLLAGLSIASLQAPAKALITNGSFELTFVPAGDPFATFPETTDINGWIVVGPQVSVINDAGTFNGISLDTPFGNQWLDISGETFGCPDCGVTQTINTSTGQVYDLSFYVGSATDGSQFFPASVDLSINGGSRQSFFNSAAPTTFIDWKLFTVPFTATSATTNLTFYDGNASFNSFNISSALDNVSVTAVPGPLPLLGVGSAFLWSRRLRKRIKG